MYKPVYVLNKQGKPLMPTIRYRHVRKLLEIKQAVPVCNNPFTIRLKYETPDIIQDLYLGIDTGRENIGLAVSKNNGDCIYLAELKTNNKSIHLNMQERRVYRRYRRHNHRAKKQRKSLHDNTQIIQGKNEVLRSKKNCKAVEISYPGMEKSITHKVIRGKEAKFNNRKCDKGWLTPSGRQLIQMHLLIIEKIQQILPISYINIERVSFDFQKLENQDISTWRYSQGPLFGFKDYRELIRHKQQNRCLLCNKEGIDQYHHIIMRSQGGSDKVSNIAGLCNNCHDLVHKYESYQDKLSLLVDRNNTYKISLLNSIMPQLLFELNNYCTENTINLHITDGYITSQIRNKLGIKVKQHCIDAYCISTSLLDISKAGEAPDKIYYLRRYKKKSNNKISHYGSRKYFYKHKLVGINRRKALGQLEDSLEDFVNTYRLNHTGLEVKQMLSQLKVQSAKRIYTYHKYKTYIPFHPGDTIKFHGKHGKIITEIFICQKLNVSLRRVVSLNIGERLFNNCIRLNAGCIS